MKARKHLLGVVAGAGLVALAGVAQAQQATPFTNTATLNAQPNLLCVSAGAVNTTVTCTVTPTSNQAVYVTAVYLDVCSNATGTAATNTFFTLTGPSGFATAQNAWEVSIAATANICQHWGDTAGGAVLMKTAAGTPFVVTSPAQSANNGFGIRVYGYLAQ